MSAQVFTGRYQMVRQLARGGMADVYLARDLLLDRPVALKVLFPQFSSDMSFVERFRREARAAANLNHPNIVSIFDWGEDDGTYFIVMEYVDGPTLREMLQADGPLPAVEVASMSADIAGALHFAHLHGVIHRDVKPGNVLVAHNRVKVTDFGIARAGDPSEALTQAGSVMGTATYFSPEQAQGHPVDPRSDIYSLGVVMYELVAGRPPFMGDSPVAIAYQHVREEPDPPSAHNPDVPPAFEDLILRALSKNPDDRFGDAEELRDSLMAFARGDEPSIPPPPLPPPPPPVPVPPRRPVADATVVDPVPVGAAAEGTRVLAPRRAVIEEEEQRPPPRTGTYIAVLLGLLALLGGLLFLLSRELGVSGGSAEVTVPEVIGNPVDEAVRKLEDAGLEVARTEVTDLVNPPGQVVHQDPSAGTRVRRGDTVRISVSSQAPPVGVPSVTGLRVDVATSRLREAGFEVTEERRPHDQAPPDVVFEQNPPGGAQAPAGSAVAIVVSGGPQPIRVPDVRNRDASDAANALGQAGFRISSRREFNGDVPEGRVIRTEPEPGTALPRGSTVTVVVSGGPVPTTQAPTTTDPPPTTSSTTTSTSTTTTTEKKD